MAFVMYTLNILTVVKTTIRSIVAIFAGNMSQEKPKIGDGATLVHTVMWLAQGRGGDFYPSIHLHS